MEIFFSFFLFPIFHSPSAREIVRKQKELEKYFSYCTLHRAITSTYSVIEVRYGHHFVYALNNVFTLLKHAMDVISSISLLELWNPITRNSVGHPWNYHNVLYLVLLYI